MASEAPTPVASPPGGVVVSRLMSALQTDGHRVGRHTKVTVVGAGGAVGLAAAFAIINQGLCSELALVDVAADKLKGELMDLQHGSAFTRRVRIRASSSYDVAEGSDFVIITAGARQREGESRLDLVGRNVAIFRGLVPPIVSGSPAATICVVSNPCDVLTAVTARLEEGDIAGKIIATPVYDPDRQRVRS